MSRFPLGSPVAPALLLGGPWWGLSLATEPWAGWSPGRLINSDYGGSLVREDVGVDRLYDQGGNGRDWHQDTDGKQPTLVSAAQDYITAAVGGMSLDYAGGAMADTGEGMWVYVSGPQAASATTNPWQNSAAVEQLYSDAALNFNGIGGNQIFGTSGVPGIFIPGDATFQSQITGGIFVITTAWNTSGNSSKVWVNNTLWVDTTAGSAFKPISVAEGSKLFGNYPQPFYECAAWDAVDEASLTKVRNHLLSFYGIS